MINFSRLTLSGVKLVWKRDDDVVLSAAAHGHDFQRVAAFWRKWNHDSSIVGNGVWEIEDLVALLD